MGRGRPKGSKNKLKAEVPTETIGLVRPSDLDTSALSGVGIVVPTRNIKDLKREIRALKKLKLECRAGSPERIELYRKIKELKVRLIALKKVKSEVEIPILDEKKYKKTIIYTGYLSEATKQRMRDNYDINFIKESMSF